MRTDAIVLTVSGLVLWAAAAAAQPADPGGVFTAALSPEIYQPTGGNALHVFALAEAR